MPVKARDIKEKAWLYQRLEDFPLPLFIRLVVESDLEALVRSGEPEQADLEEARRNIMAQWAESLDPEGVRGQLNQDSEMVGLESRIYRVNMMALVLWHGYDEAVANSLREEDFNLEFSPTDEEARRKDVEMVKVLLKADEVRLQMLQEAAGEDGTGKPRKPEKITAKWFDEVLINIFTVFGSMPDKDKLTAMQFCLLICRLRERAAASRTKNKPKQYSE